MEYVYAGLYFGGSALATWLALHISVARRKARDWPTVPGRILERGVSGAGRFWSPHVKYAYSVADQEYISERLHLVGKVRGLESKVRRLVDGLPDPVPVHYDPQDPRQSYLLTISTGWIIFIVAVAVFAFLMGFMLLVIAVGRSAGVER